MGDVGEDSACVGAGRDGLTLPGPRVLGSNDRSDFLATVCQGTPTEFSDLNATRFVAYRWNIDICASTVQERNGINKATLSLTEYLVHQVDSSVWRGKTMEMNKTTKSKQVNQIKVVGLGGGGISAVNHMISHQVQGVEFICVDSCARSLISCGSCETLQIGATGLGAAQPIRGRWIAEHSIDRISRAIDGAQMLVIIASLSGGTGSGAAPVIARLSKEMGILTVGVVSTPCEWEGRKRMQIAEIGLAELKSAVDFLVVLPLERLMDATGDDVTREEFFACANDLVSDVVLPLVAKSVDDESLWLRGSE